EKDGATLEEIEKLLRDGVPAVVYFIEPSEDEHHYAVVTGLTDKEIVLADPWNGADFRMMRDEFEKRWYGYEDEKNRWLLAVYNEPFCGCNCDKK
ncbi:MAG TPA: cysteine peptidase family C39 domain-containing protein, partial [Candidatus Paceibacterota bacterium]|nr:cysteine peptidase family C39 domain-containing protein [Candidatus Paceibacterota bacterium]